MIAYHTAKVRKIRSLEIGIGWKHHIYVTGIIWFGISLTRDLPYCYEWKLCDDSSISPHTSASFRVCLHTEEKSPTMLHNTTT